MNYASAVLTQVYRFVHDGQELIQVNSFRPDLTLSMVTYLPPESGKLTDDDIFYELEYPVQESKRASLVRRFEKEFASLPPGRPDSPASLQAEGEELLIKYAWEVDEEPSEAYLALDEYITRIVSFSSTPSG